MEGHTPKSKIETKGAPVIKEGVDFVFKQNPELKRIAYENLGYSYKNYRGDATPVIIDYFGQGTAGEIGFSSKNKGIKTADKAKIDELVKSFLNIGQGNFLEIHTESGMRRFDFHFIARGPEDTSRKGYHGGISLFFKDKLPNPVDLIKSINKALKDYKKENYILHEDGRYIPIKSNFTEFSSPKIYPTFSSSLDIPKDLSENDFKRFFMKEFNSELERQNRLEQESTQLYSNYLETIFPESKVKEIVWHGTDVDFKNEGFKAMPPSSHTKWFTDESLGNRFYFTNDYNKAQKRYSLQNGKPGIMVAALLNLKNPKDDDTYDGTDLRDKDLSGYDSYIQKATYQADGTKNSQYFVAFDPEQIHILGSQSDIEGFKKFVESKEK